MESPQVPDFEAFSSSSRPWKAPFLRDNKVAIDREDSLRRAEKLLRQGRLDGAIQEYVRLLEEYPNDWNSRNMLGDLYVRAKQVEQAAGQFTHIADHFAQEGFFPRAIALYKKVIRIRPDDEHALLESADINGRQGLLVDAKSCLNAVAEQRRNRGDKTGANEILIQIGTLDPSDFGARRAAARAAADNGDTPGALQRYKDLAAELFDRDRASDAIEALAEAVRLDPADDSVRDSLVAAYLRTGDVGQARRYATTALHFKTIAEDFFARGQENEALDALGEVLQRDPSDNETRTRLVRSLVARGDVERAAGCLPSALLGDDPNLLLLAAEVNLSTGRADAGCELVRTVIEREPGRRDAVVGLACGLAARDRDVAFQCVEVVTGAEVTKRDWAAAARTLQEFLTHASLHIPALIRLVDVCVDGDLDDVLLRAQAQLAEAYLGAERAVEARVIAEDLVTRNPGDTENIDRFRRALVMLGEPDPEAVIADRLNPDSTFVLGDLNAELEDLNAGEPPLGGTPETAKVGAALVDQPATPADPVSEPPSRPLPPPSISQRPAVARPEIADIAVSAPAVAIGPTVERRAVAGTAAMPRLARTEAPEDLGGATVSLDAIFAGHNPVHADSAAGGEWEIDLSGALATADVPEQPPLRRPGVTPTATPAPAAKSDLEDVFEGMRREVASEQATTTAAQHYKLALTYHDMGMTEECLKALQVAARSPRYRFQAASLLGRLHRRDGRVHDALDWFERAAESPAPNVDAGRALLYELGEMLENEGESVRALAVYLELQADAGDYRDVGERIRRLSR